PLTLQEAMRLMGDMQGLEELEQELLEAARANDSSRLDADEIGRLIGDEARRMAEELQEFRRMLEEAGFIQRNGKGWELTPRALPGRTQGGDGTRQPDPHEVPAGHAPGCGVLLLRPAAGIAHADGHELDRSSRNRLSGGYPGRPRDAGQVPRRHEANHHDHRR